MAIRMYLNRTRTIRRNRPGLESASDMRTTVGTTAQTDDINVTPSDTLVQHEFDEIGLPHTFFTPRLAADATISADIAFTHASYMSAAGLNATIHVKVYRVTSGGGDVETLIGEGTSGDIGSTSGVQKTMTIPVPTPVVVYAGERIALRVYATRLDSGTPMGTGIVKFDFGGFAAAFDDTSLDLPDGLTWMANTTKLFARRTNVTGIGNFFDLLLTNGASASTTGVVNTVAGGTQVQWTRTAGGTVLEWISPRAKVGWTFSATSELPANNFFSIEPSVHESATAANCGWRVKCFRRRGSSEVECFSGDDTSELATSSQSRTVSSTMAGVTVTATDFLPDDRLVVRLYIIPASGQTMGGSRTCTVTYDNNTTTATGNVLVTFQDMSLDFKAEGDPAETGIIPSGTSTMGLGNGQ
jgi:hypothetical protein